MNKCIKTKWNGGTGKMTFSQVDKNDICISHVSDLGNQVIENGIVQKEIAFAIYDDINFYCGDLDMAGIDSIF